MSAERFSETMPTPTSLIDSTKVGMVLSGGGARGAYEAGVLHYLFVSGPQELRERVQVDILSGTSIGALHATALGAGLQDPQTQIQRVVDLWKSLSLEQVLSLQIQDLLSLSKWILGRSKQQSIFPAGPIQALLADMVNWQQLHDNLNHGLLEGITVSCTQVPTGKTVVFYETSDGRERKFSRDPHVYPVYARLNQKHAQASAAIPFVFPPVTIDGISYVDGGLRQNTPLSPALRLGSSRLLVIGMGHEKSMLDTDEAVEWRRLSSPIFLLAKVVNALMLDRVDYDLIRLDHFNRLLMQGQSAFGHSFTDRMNQVLEPLRKSRYRYVPYLAIRPSKDIGKMAARFLKTHSVRTKQPLMARLVKLLARLEHPSEADLCSYLLFDGRFCGQLIELGMEDAHRQKEALMKFFDPNLLRDNLDRSKHQS